MYKLFLIWICLQLGYFANGQSSKGEIVIVKILAVSLKNPGGEDPNRRVTIYLPPGYDKTTTRYPVIYYLHGFTRNDSLQISADHLDKLLDTAINSGVLKPVIVVMPNHNTSFRGSWYTNSTLTGNWVDFTARELVAYIDSRYRTISNPKNRGIAGHSMGGYGALKIAMMFPETFGSVYAMSPSRLSLIREFGPDGEVFKQAQMITTKGDLLKNYRANLAIAMGRALSPNIKKPPFYCDLPFSYKGDSVIVNERVLELWNKNSPLFMVGQYAENLKKLTAIKLDWGRNDDSEHIPITCLMLSKKLEELGIEHYAEEYIGTHVNKLWTKDGRAINDMFPFFNTYLSFDAGSTNPVPTH